MTKEEINAYSVRVSQSSQTGLVVLSYEIALTYLEEARKEHEKGNRDNFVKNINKSRQFIQELSRALDFRYPISKDLFSLYLFMDRTLSEGVIKNTAEKISAVIGMIKKLMAAFQEIENQNPSQAAMANTEKIYAGLTYSRDSLNEYKVR